MGKHNQRLTDLLCKKAEPKNGKPVRIPDRDQLYLQVTPGKRGTSKSWLFRYKDRWLGLGPYPEITLERAREKAGELRRQQAEGKDPGVERKLEAVKTNPKTFAEVVKEYHDTFKADWTSEQYSRQWLQEIEHYTKPIADIPVAAITIAHVADTLKKDWTRAPVLLKRTRAKIEAVLDRAIAKGYRPEGKNPADWAILRHLLPSLKAHKYGHHAALPFAEVGDFVRALRGGAGRSDIGRKPLEFLILTAARTGEVRGARWSEIDWDARVWHVPAARTKMRKAHRVPLSGAAWAILVGLRGERTVNPNAYIFPGEDGDHAPVSDDVIRKLVQDIRPTCVNPETRETETPTAHGFRSTFREWCGEELTDVPEEVAELALAHAVGSQTRRAYRRGDALTKRVALMEDWATFVAGKVPLQVVA